jgi:hypothetical protein
MTAIDATYLVAQHIVVKGDLVGAQRVLDAAGARIKLVRK